MFAPRYFPKRYFAGRYFPPVTSGGFGGWTETTTGGISFGGAAAVSQTYAEPTVGGLTFGGEAAVSNTYVDTTDGGITFGGAAIVQWIPAGTGGLIRRLWYRLGLGF
jgi:hypothetical protein